MLERDAIVEALQTRVVRVNALAFALASGFVAGLGLFAATDYLVVKGGPVVGPHLALLGQFFVGYHVTLWGSVVGFAYASVTVGLAAYVVARLYNWVARLRER